MKRLSLICILMITIAVQAFAVLNVDNTTPLSDHHRVIYELNVYDFTSQGTFAAATQRLPELRTLGIDIIWLMPIHPRGIQGKIGSLGSPYAVRDYTAVNPAHGTLTDLQTFVTTAHSLGMQVWLDWVPNHTALDHAWVTSHPEYYVRSNGVIQHPNNYGDVYQLDYSSTEMKNAMIDAMRYWVNTADIDGFRCDYASSPAIGSTFWTQAITALQTNDRNKTVEFMAEADFTGWDVDQSLYNCGFRYDYAWGYADGIKSVNQGTSCSNLKNAANSLLNVLGNKYANMSRMSYLTNHDDIGNNFSGNYMTQCGDNVPPLTVMYFTFFGMPLLYNGQEIGSTTILNYFNRNTINWSNVNTQIHNTIRALIALKHTLPALADGKASERASTRIINTNNSSVFAFEKTKGDNTVLVVLNLGTSATNVTLSGITAGAYTRVLNSETIATGFTTDAVNLAASPTIRVGAKGYHVYTNGADYTTHHLYVEDCTQWAQFDLYAWGDCEFFGAWPGATSALVVSINGSNYRDYEYTVAQGQTDMTMHLIFHNNVGENKPGDRRQLIDLTQTGDYFISVSDAGYNVTPTGIEPVELDTPSAQNRKLLQNGQLYILHNGLRYSILGLRY